MRLWQLLQLSDVQNLQTVLHHEFGQKGTPTTIRISSDKNQTNITDDAQDSKPFWTQSHVANTLPCPLHKNVEMQNLRAVITLT